MTSSNNKYPLLIKQLKRGAFINLTENISMEIL